MKIVKIDLNKFESLVSDESEQICIDLADRFYNTKLSNTYDFTHYLRGHSHSEIREIMFNCLKESIIEESE